MQIMLSMSLVININVIFYRLQLFKGYNFPSKAPKNPKT